MTGYSTVRSVTRHEGAVITLRTDTVRMPDGSVADRDVVVHPGAVGVVALGTDLRVLLVRQYRHPLGRRLWELPAGLRDEEGEEPVDTARRELFEETGHRADEWELLVEYDSSPGMTDEHALVYLASGAALAAEPREQPSHEEADIELRWLPLDEALAWVRNGTITNVMAVVGVLAAADRLARPGGG